VRDHQNGRPATPKLADAGRRFLLKFGVAHRQYFVDDQHLRADVGGHRETQARHHAAGVGSHRGVDEIADSRKIHDPIQPASNVLAAETQHRAVEKNVFASGHFVIEARAQFQQRRDPSAQSQSSPRGAKHPSDDLEQGAFPGAVGTDDADGFALFDRKANVVQGVEIGVADPAPLQPADGVFLEGGNPLVWDSKAHRHVVDLDHRRARAHSR